MNENSALVLNQTPNKSKTNTNSVVLVDNREVSSELVANKEVGNNGEHSIIDQTQHVVGTDVPEMLNGIFEPLDIDYQLATTDLQMVPWKCMRWTIKLIIKNSGLV